MAQIPKVATAGLDALLRRIAETVNVLIGRAALIDSDNAFTGTNTFAASPQVVNAAQAIFDVKSSGAQTPLVRMWVSDAHKGGFGAVPSSDAWGSGTDVGDILAYAVTGSFIFTGDNGATVHFEVDENGVITGSGVDMTPATGTFTPTVDGFSGTPTALDVTWARMGNIVVVTLSTITGTSDSAVFAITNVPAALAPATSQLVKIRNATDNGSSVEAYVRVHDDGDWDFATESGGVAGWTASGTKALSPGTTFTFSLL